MTDFHDELGRALHAAARRRSRRPWLAAFAPTRPRPLAAVAAVAAVAVLAVAAIAVGLGGAERERDVAGPGPPAGATETATCSDPAPPSAVADVLGVLGRPATPADRPSDDLLRTFASGRVGGEHPARTYPGHARLARPGSYVLPALFGAACDRDSDDAARAGGACLLTELPSPPAVVCGRLAAIERRGLGPVDARLAHGRWASLGLLGDGARAYLQRGDVRLEGEVDGNVAFWTYGADAYRAGESRIVMGDAAPGCAPEPAAVVLARFPVFDRPPVPARAISLEPHEVVHVHEAHARPIRYGSGLELLAIPALIGGCHANAMPGVCLAPADDERWPTDCLAVDGDAPRRPTVIALRHANEHGETEIAGIASHGTRGALVTWPGGQLEVDNEGGRIQATVPHGEPAAVGITPIARP